MFASRLWVLPTLVLAVAACGGGEDGAEVVADPSVAAVTPAPSATTPPTTPAESTMTGHSSASTPVQLTALNNSGVTGQAQIMEHGAAETMVTVTLQGQGSGTHPGHIHSGTCDNLGPVVAPLESVAMASGTGTSSSTVKVPMSTVMNGQHVVNYHAGSGENPMAPIACGAIPAHGAGGHGA